MDFLKIVVLFVFSGMLLNGQEMAAPPAGESPEVVPVSQAEEENQTDISEAKAKEKSVDAPEAENEEKPLEKRSPIRKRNRPVKVKMPKDLFGAPTEDSPSSEETMLGGTIPAIWEIELKSPGLEEDELSPVLERDSMAPAVPAKVIRYAVWLIQKYDENGDGFLQEGEWKKMPGSPQAIDINGDGRVTLEELVRFIGLYGKDRTIHRPYPVERYHQPRMVSSQFQIFKPVTGPPATSATPESEKTGDLDDKTAKADESKDLSEEEMESDTVVLDDATYEEIIAGRQIPADRKYHTSREALFGVPAWFIVLDRDGDGQVSLTEFAPSLSAPSLALFGRLDKNGDGLITPDEVRVPSASQSPRQNTITPAVPDGDSTKAAQ